MSLSMGHRGPQRNIAMVPRTDVPRSTFRTQHTLKTTFGSGTLVPIHLDEVLPGDTHSGRVTLFARLATLLFPLMDTVYIETFFFFVPARLVWTNFVKMMGERKNPADSISYVIPTIPIDQGVATVCSIWDYFGIPPAGQIGASVFNINVLPLRAYNLIWNEWFRDENLQNSLNVALGDSGDNQTDYALRRRNKRKDYFTGALPWPLKGGVDVTIPLQGQAPITGIAFNNASTPTAGNPAGYQQTGGSNSNFPAYYLSTAAATIAFSAQTGAGADPLIYADLSTATGATINALRLAFQTQRLLERDARSGTRYTELVTAHFGVRPQDMRLQRPEYIGGGRTDLQTQAIPFTAQDRNASNNAINNPVGALGAAATATGQHHFNYNATEHGYIIGLANLTAEVTYQQGLHRLWTRSTRYDFYWPVFANLGEQIVRNDEIYVQGTAADTQAFGYQERWAEYRQMPSRITGLFRSTSAGTIDPWHVAQKFTALPVLNTSFIQDQPPISRALAAGSLADNMQVILDSLWNISRTRPMPVYSVPGNIDRF